MTIEYLNDFEKKIKNYDYELKKIYKELKKEDTKNYIDSVSGSSAMFPFTKKHFVIEGISPQKHKFLLKRIKVFNYKKRKLINEFNYKLRILEDRQLANIIEQKYLHRKEWKQIAIESGYASESGVRQYVKRNLKND